ncbi:hypothetical protein FHR87_002505 [Azomonas macrocytogenes]|uniref:Uncharacterized protein n=1 Tax=Azomonas macrocytogenes TaxID=69962 RepID=A0A839T8X6_AZOMA|nr:hypothetical protein [Azomonas macrocytogenes]
MAYELGRVLGMSIKLCIASITKHYTTTIGTNLYLVQDRSQKL